jgi:hypothetical protein
MNTAKKTRLAFPFHRQLFEYLRSIAKAPLSTGQRAACHRIMLRWVWRHRRALWTDYDWSLRVMLGPFVRRLRPS